MEPKNEYYSNKSNCKTTFSIADVLICGDKSSSVCTSDGFFFGDRVWISPSAFPLKTFVNLTDRSGHFHKPSPDFVKDLRVSTMCA